MPEAFNLQTTLDKYLSTLPDDWGAISPADLNQYLQSTKPFLVDVRETKEFTDGGFVAGAINIPIRTFIKNLDKLPAPDQPIVVTCGSGHRSAMAMAALQLLGYKNVKSLAGGLSAWKAANLPVATGAPPEAKTGKAPDVNQNLYNTLDKYFSTLPDGWGTLAPAALNEMLKSSQPFQLDVREAKEIADAGAIAGATKIPLRTLVKNLDKLPPDKNAAIVAECANGHRSAITMLALNLLGYTNTRSLAGGINAWIKANLPVVK
jgi:rhodanese-related sulfurtransferase